MQNLKFRMLKMIAECIEKYKKIDGSEKILEELEVAQAKLKKDVQPTLERLKSNNKTLQLKYVEHYYIEGKTALEFLRKNADYFLDSIKKSIYRTCFDVTKELYGLNSKSKKNSKKKK